TIDYLPSFGTGYGARRIGFTVGQEIYTPANLTDPAPIPTDRPYAGWLYFKTQFQRRGLEAGLSVLKPGGRLAVITFHSLEDRLVKEWGRERARDYTVPGGVDVPELRQPRRPEVVLVSRKAIQPGAAEVETNPRARSAQLRVFEKTAV
ncbi:MAG: DUF2219 family protein, partial [Rhodobacteraceae bacterium]|nr:DUF2219 family protein [Paracoccaceae bacterium]